MRPSWIALVSALAACSELIGINDVPDPNSDAAVMLEASADSPSADDGPIVDTGIDTFTVADGGPCTLDAGTCSDLSLVPAGWTPVVLSTSDLSCPAGFAGSNTFVDPVAMNGACTCTAANIQAPTCVVGNISRSNGPSCNTNQSAIAVNGGCNVVSGTIGSSERIGTAPPGGSCTSSPQAHPNLLTTATASVCSPVQCPNDVCGGLAPQGHIACIQTAGDAACPATGPFKNQRLVGDLMTLDCGNACTTCAASATCSNPILALYSDGNCGTGVTTFNADNMCSSTGQAGITFGSVLYSATASNPQYVPSGTGTAKVARTNAKTLCCK